MTAISTEDLIRLARSLRADGFDVGTNQILASQDLLLALARHGLLVPRESAEPYLRPLFCSNPEEQKRFRVLFLEWLKTPGKGRAILPIQPTESVGRQWPRRRWMISAAIFVLAAISGAIYYRAQSTIIRPPVARPAATSVRPTPNQEVNASVSLVDDQRKPVRDATLWYLGQRPTTDALGRSALRYAASKQNYPLLITHNDYNPMLQPLGLQPTRTYTLTLKQGHTRPTPPPVPVLTSPGAAGNQEALRRFQIIRIIGTATPLVLTSAWWLWTFLRRLKLKKWRSFIDPGNSRFPVRRPDAGLFGGPELQRTVQALRRRQPQDLHDLSPELTAVATAEKLGRFTPVYTSRHIMPEYLALIDRTGPHDQLARFEDELLNKLRGGVYVDRYFYSSDPHSCYNEQSGPRNLTLPDLAARHGDHTLLVFGDGTSFFDPVTLTAQRWLDSLLLWQRRVLVTPRDPAEWSNREWALASREFQIVHASLGAIAQVSHKSAPESKGRRVGISAAPRRFPGSIERHSDRWTKREPPEAPDVARVTAELREYLGPAGFDWLCACAVYPSLHWALTNHLGWHLGVVDFEDTLRCLVRLPWFRIGSMPDWFRGYLLGRMSRDLRMQVEKALDEFLSPEPPKTGATEEIELVIGRRPTAWTWPFRPKRTTPAKDYVFLCFLMGRQPDRLTIPGPGRLRRRLFHEGHWWLGISLWSSLAVAILLCVAVWFAMGLWKPPSSKPERIKKPPPPVRLVSGLAQVAVGVAETQLQDQAYFDASGTRSASQFTDWCFTVAGLLLRQNPSFAMLQQPPALRGDLLQIPSGSTRGLINFVAANGDEFATVELVNGRVQSQYYTKVSARGVVRSVMPSGLPPDVEPEVPPVPRAENSRDNILGEKGGAVPANPPPMALSQLENAPVVGGTSVVLKNAFISAIKNRATVDITMVVDHVLSHPHRISQGGNDGDLHISGRSKDIGLPMVAEIMNAGSAAESAVLRDAEQAANGSSVAMSGVWRIWFEKPGDDQIQDNPVPLPADTNPDHVFEIHPVTRLGGDSAAASFAPIPGYEAYDAQKAFPQYERVQARIQSTDTATTIETTKIGYNYAEFLIVLGAAPTASDDGGFFVLAKVMQKSGQPVVSELRRMVFAPGTPPFSLVASCTAGAQLHVLGIPRINLEAVASLTAQAPGTWIQVQLPYEMVIVAVFADSASACRGPGQK
jgi:hypothetical protein